MLTTVIIDDEEHSRNRLKGFLQSEANIQIIGEADHVEAGVKLIEELNPELIFLDIEMPDGTGFDILDTFPRANFQVIFITGHNDYAIKAFKHSAIDYILKPLEEIELKRALEKAHQNSGRIANFEKLEFMLNSLKTNEFSKIAIPSMDSIEFIHKNDIVCCEADGNYTTIYLTGNKQMLASYSLKKVNDLLLDTNFFRIHKSFILNINYIQKVLKKDGGEVLMENGVRIPIARRKKEEFQKLIGL